MIGKVNIWLLSTDTTLKFYGRRTKLFGHREMLDLPWRQNSPQRRQSWSYLKDPFLMEERHMKRTLSLDILMVIITGGRKLKLQLDITIRLDTLATVGSRNTLLIVGSPPNDTRSMTRTVNGLGVPALMAVRIGTTTRLVLGNASTTMDARVLSRRVNNRTALRPARPPLKSPASPGITH